MEKYIIFIDFDEFEYVDYYKLICNGETIDSVPQEESRKIVDFLMEKCCPIELSIVKTPDASEWEYREAFGPSLVLKDTTPDATQIQQQLEMAEGRHFSINQNDSISEGARIEILFSGVCAPETDDDLVEDPLKKAEAKSKDDSIEETLKQTEEILKSGGERMTTLAEIIKKKYEELNNHG